MSKGHNIATFKGTFKLATTRKLTDTELGFLMIKIEQVTNETHFGIPGDPTNYVSARLHIHTETLEIKE